MEKPIFIFAQARSGSTLLQRVLNSVEDVVLYGEHLGILKGIADSYCGFMAHRSRYGFCSDSPDTAAVHAEAFKRLKDPSDFAAITNGLNLAHVSQHYHDFVKNLLHPVSTSSRWGFKEIRYGCGDSVFEMLRDLFPGARFVFLVRHPMHQLASIEGTGWWQTTFDENFDTWFLQTSTYLKHRQAHPERTLLVRYEDFTDPKASTAAKLFEFLECPYGAAQEQIIFHMDKVGKAEKKPVYSGEVESRIKTMCRRPEVAELGYV